MDPNTSFDLEIRIISRNLNSQWDLLNKVVDADFTNFRDLVDEVLEKYPPCSNEIASLFYFSMDRKTNIQICSDQDLVEMFAKHKASKCCLLSVCYHNPDSEPPEIPTWEFSGTVHSIEAPFTPSVSCPMLPEPSLQSHTQSADTDFLANPNPSFDHVGIDEEGLYIDIGFQNPIPDASNEQGQSEMMNQTHAMNLDIDEIVKDREPAQKPEADYDKLDPPMAVTRNPYPHECHSTRRADSCVGVTQF
ncbi:hypothetical protein PVAP13_5NG332843 [Panicum virgatum]|uniref:PB1 domain-containing protein n=1 Tax=Panicum virgatum TaxID=38727 RepID=A0A8T0RSR5_PANVG|nr:hypothetical protein PVAP13_5NG332843 [Panicum virgatum]